MTGKRNEGDRFDAALRDWGGRGPRTPAATAAARVVSQIGAPSAQGHAGWRVRPFMTAVAAAALVAVVAGVVWWSRDAGPARAPSGRTAAELPPTLPENVVQFWLDAETPVYFVTGPLQGPRGGTP